MTNFLIIRKFPETLIESNVKKIKFYNKIMLKFVSIFISRNKFKEEQNNRIIQILISEKADFIS